MFASSIFAPLLNAALVGILGLALILLLIQALQQRVLLRRFGDSLLEMSSKVDKLGGGLGSPDKSGPHRSEINLNEIREQILAVKVQIQKLGESSQAFQSRIEAQVQPAPEENRDILFQIDERIGRLKGEVRSIARAVERPGGTNSEHDQKPESSTESEAVETESQDDILRQLIDILNAPPSRQNESAARATENPEAQEAATLAVDNAKAEGCQEARLSAPTPSAQHKSRRPIRHLVVMLNNSTLVDRWVPDMLPKDDYAASDEGPPTVDSLISKPIGYRLDAGQNLLGDDDTETEHEDDGSEDGGKGFRLLPPSQTR